MALPLLFSGSFWVLLVSLVLSITTLNNSTALVVDSVTSTTLEMGTFLEHSTSNGVLTPTPSTAFSDNEESSLEISVGASTGPTVSKPMPSKKASTIKPLVPLEIVNGTSDPAIPIRVNTQEYRTVTGGATTFNSLETSARINETNTTSSPEPSSGASGLPITDTSSGASGPPVTNTTSSPEPSGGASGLPVTSATSSLETSSGASGPPVTNLSTDMSTRSPDQERKGMLLVPLLVALLVVVVLVAFLLLWRQRQKRRTGVLTLSSGKHNGVVDAWAGPAQVHEEEALTEAVAGAGGEKGCGVPETEGSARRPTLTTFFSRRKSHQGSLAMEELKSSLGPGLKAEEEPLVGSEDEATEGAASKGPNMGDGVAPQRL
uniref:Sialophorin n=1 Tax=Cavia porcellus TaxID=10141 RepID=H0W1Q9_CAVPO